MTPAYISDHIDSLSEHLRPAGYLNPARDWSVMIVLSTIVLAGVIVWNVWAFDTVANGGIIGAPIPEQVPTFNQSSLDTIHSIFVHRADEEAKYQSGVYQYIDPSH
ncbi:MAG: hypothetical protein KGJ31_02855 [Patescibacteria group bacterium]|nr:hypothetical protein [Patescibacteria group bacterium]